MSKFNVGDKVRVVKAKDDGSPTTKEFIGKEGVVNQTGGYFGYNVKFADDVWAFYPDELEAADPTPEARLEQAKALVAEIEQEIKDAKKDAFSELGIGTVFQEREGSNHILWVKVGENQWVWVRDGVAVEWCGNMISTDNWVKPFARKLLQEGVK